MSLDVEFVAADATAQEAAQLMGELDVGALPLGSAEMIAGIVTDRDILYRVVARGLDPAATRVREIASRPAIACRASDTVAAAMDIMAANYVRRLPVRDEAAERVVGWITLADIARRLLVDSAPLQQALRDTTEP